MKNMFEPGFGGAPFRVRLYTCRRALRGVATALLSLLLLAACATNPTASRDKAIERRSQARWDALLAGDYAKAYSYASPGYRSSTSLTDFEIAMRLRRVQYTSAHYREHRCEDASCTVRIDVAIKVVRPFPQVPEWESTAVIDERWVRIDGEWWFLPKS